MPISRGPLFFERRERSPNPLRIARSRHERTDCAECNGYTRMVRVVGKRKQHDLRSEPSGTALKASAALQEVALALAAVRTTGVRQGVYRFATLAQADAHKDEALARAIAENLLARKLVS